MLEQINIDHPPIEITAFLDRLRSTGQRIVPGSLIWVKHPTKPGWMVPAVRVETVDTDATIGLERTNNVLQ